jgi:hypothetical protein
MQRAKRLGFVLAVLLVATLLFAEVPVEVEFASGPYWRDLTQLEKFRFVEGFKMGAFMTMRTFRLKGYGNTDAYQMLLPAVDGTPVLTLITEIDFFYESPQNQEVPIFGAIIQTRRQQ